MYSHLCLVGGWKLPACVGLWELVVYVALGLALVLMVDRWVAYV